MNPANDDGRSKKAPLLEHSMAGVGLLLVIASLGFLLYQGLWGDHTPPDVIIEVRRVSESGDDFLVQFRARNGGGKTAANVPVTGELRRAGEPPETAEITLDYVPAGSTVEGGLFFRSDPRNGELRLYPGGYEEP